MDKLTNLDLDSEETFLDRFENGGKHADRKLSEHLRIRG